MAYLKNQKSSNIEISSMTQKNYGNLRKSMRTSSNAIVLLNNIIWIIIIENVTFYFLQAHDLKNKQFIKKQNNIPTTNSIYFRVMISNNIGNIIAALKFLHLVTFFQPLLLKSHYTHPIRHLMHNLFFQEMILRSFSAS